MSNSSKRQRDMFFIEADIVHPFKCIFPVSGYPEVKSGLYSHLKPLCSHIILPRTGCKVLCYKVMLAIDYF